MAVPAHEAHHEFASKYGAIIEVVSGSADVQKGYTGDGKLVNSDFLDGLGVDDAKEND